MIWLWAAEGFFLWATAHTVETFIAKSAAASNLAVDGSDFIYVISAFPLLMAFSTTRQTASVRTIFYLNCAQLAVAFILTYYLLYRMSMAPATAAVVMGRIYGAACALLAVLGTLRLLACETLEERRTFLTICIFLWLYLPIEVGMDYGTQHWNLHAGNLLDLLWSVPFVVAGWQALRLPIEGPQPRPRKTRQRSRLLVETLCPLLITLGIFALAAAVTPQHPVAGLSAIFLLLVILGLQSGVLQLNYLMGQSRLLEREQELRNANAALEELSLLDPLTSIANRRGFDAALEEAWRRAERRQEWIALLIIDVDFFKGANDLHGHTYGDGCIVTVAQVLDQQTGRPYDLLARYGGDEFLLLLPDTDSAGATAVAERIHAAVRQQGVENRASPLGGRLTVTIGIGVIQVKPGVDADRLVEIADRALYQAKRDGRNRTGIQTL